MITKDNLRIAIRSLHHHLQCSKRKHLVIGVSGGVDSAATLALLLEMNKTFPGFYEIIPVSCPIGCSIGTTEQYEAHELAASLCAHFKIPLRTIPLGTLSKQTMKSLEADSSYLVQQVDYWLRPMAFYKVSMENPNSILVGTINKSEWDLGWFSQYLDVLGVNPIIDLLKSEVYQLADMLGVPSFITKVPPKGGLASGETDEESLGFTYQQYEDFLLGPPVGRKIEKLIIERMNSSQFKRDRFNPAFVQGFFKDYY